MGKTYLTAKNILFILLAWICLIFTNPGGNSWIIAPDEYKADWAIYFIAEAIFLILCFSYKSLIDKNYKRVFLLSITAIANLGLVYFLVFNVKINMALIPFFHPITMALPVIFLSENKIKLALAGYVLGYFFSYAPLITSLIPILFMQLWFDSLTEIKTTNKISRFLSRLVIYSIVSVLIYFLIFELSNSRLLYKTVSFSKAHEIIMSLASVITIYLILNQYLKIYYHSYGKKALKLLSYIPLLWIIPLIEILINTKEFIVCNKNNEVS